MFVEVGGKSSVELQVCYLLNGTGTCCNRCDRWNNEHAQMRVQLQGTQRGNFTCGVPALGSLRAAPLNQNMRSPIAAQRHRAPVAKRQRARAMHPNSTACRSAREDLRCNSCGTIVGPVSSRVEAWRSLHCSTCLGISSRCLETTARAVAAYQRRDPGRAPQCHVGSMRRELANSHHTLSQLP
jgi:hypothetical protein